MENEVLKEKLKSFINRFESESERIKSQVHYQSVLNITNALIKIHNKEESENPKQMLSEFINQALEIDLPLGKLESLDLYNKYLLKSGQYLIRYKDFRTNAGVLHKNIIAGIIVDSIVFYFFKDKLPFYFPIFTLILGIAGYRWKKITIKENRYFGSGY